MLNGTDQPIRNSNMFNILKVAEFIRKNPNVSANEISLGTSVAIPTVYRNIRFLEDNKLIVKSEKSSSAVGRKAWIYSINGNRGHMIGVSFTKFTIGVSLTDLSGKLISQSSAELRFGMTQRHILSLIDTRIEVLLNGYFGTSDPSGNIDLIVLMVAGDIDTEKGIIEHYDEYPTLNGFSLKQYFSKKYGITTYITRFTLVAAFSCLDRMRQENIHNYVMLIISEGIGAAIMQDEKLILGSHGHLGEIASILLPNGNTLESQCDTSLLRQRLTDYIGTLESSEASRITAALKLNKQDLFYNNMLSMIYSLDTFLKENACHPLTEVVEDFVNSWSWLAYYLYSLFDTDAVVLCGCVNSSTPTIVDMMRTHLKKLHIPENLLKTVPPFDSITWIEGLALYYLDALYYEVYKKLDLL